ncbi:hypothetical protein DFA_04941 [Cavenderia fasciculata]|uniref:Transmembrane protein n=1 Tax=Cavenderia fasciculata TaxID=261658 RepID=F4PML4_CACFS|nr:uncharacterized protein DFA_04941 [Cavenderia fasciculata]EGG22811.1 hypothetical protein DFA_04941 [Cavenderia fasciculata]|eukprot:XP_004360662.1 hypothetical protein DFA_04941 [Cavenderia fasciculata]
MKSLILLLISILCILGVASSQRIVNTHKPSTSVKFSPVAIFVPSDCKYGCDYFDKENWLGAELPESGQTIYIDYSNTEFQGQQYIYAKSQIYGLTLNLTSSLKTNSIVFQLSVSSKIGALFSIGSDIELYPNTVLVANDYVWFDHGQLNIDSNAELISFGNTIFGPDTTIFLNSTAALSTHAQAEIFGNVVGPHGMLEFFGNTSLVSSSFQVGVLTFNDTLQIAQKSIGNIAILQSDNGALSITSSTVFALTVTIAENVTLVTSNFEIAGVQTTSFVGYIESDISSILQSSNGALTSFYDFDLNGQTFVVNATAFFGNGFISYLKVYNTNPNNNLLLSNVNVDQFISQPGVANALFVLEIQGTTSIAQFHGQNVQVFITGEGILDFSNANVFLGTQAQISAVGSDTALIFNNTQLSGGYVISLASEAVGIIADSTLAIPIYVTDPQTQLRISGNYSVVTQIEVVNGANMVMSDGQLYLSNYLYVWAASDCLLNLTTLVSDQTKTPIFAKQGFRFSRDSKLAVQSQSKGIALGTDYYAFVSPATISLTEFDYYPSNPNVPATMKIAYINTIEYVVFSFSSK